jgi:hypothetical protein
LVHFGCIVVGLAVHREHRVEFLEVGFAEFVQFDFDSQKEGFGFGFDPFQGGFGDVGVEGGDVDDFSLFIDVVSGAGGEEAEALSFFLEFVEVIAGYGCLDGLEFIYDGEQ